MYTSTTQIRVHYALTDQMGVVYHGRFAEFYEIGRTESIRELGFTYKDMEAMGIIMPVVSMDIKFLRPVKYDDLITVKTTLKEIPQNHKVVFYGEIYNADGQLASVGEIVLYFVQKNGMEKCSMPNDLKCAVEKFF